MSDFKIDSGVPIPEHHRASYPFHQMEVGQSFYVDIEQKPRSAVRRSAAAANSRMRPKRFVTRAEANGVRVWRVEDLEPATEEA